MGESHTGVLIDADVQPATEFGTGEIKYRKDGVTPIMQLVITWRTEERDPNVPNDDGTRKVGCSWRLEAEIRRAIKATGAEGMEEGGELTITFIGEEKVANTPGAKAKMYKASYVPPKAYIGGTVAVEEDGAEDEAAVPEDKAETVRSLWDAKQPIELITRVTGLSKGQVESVIGLI